MVYPDLNMKEIDDFVKFWEGRDTDCSGLPIEDYYKSAELMVSHIRTDLGDVPWKCIESSLIVCRQNADLLTDRGLQIVNKLLGDTKLRRKIRPASDGSFLNNRVWCPVQSLNKIDLIPEVSYKLIPDALYWKHDSKMIDWIYNHFDIIHIQIPIFHTRKDIVSYTLAYSDVDDDF